MVRTFTCLLIALGLVGCGGEAGGQQPSATPAPRQTPIIIPSATPTLLAAESEIDLKQALITRDDLGRAWYGSSAALPILVPVERCAPARPFVSYGSQFGSTRTLSLSEGGPWLTEMLLVYPDREETSSAFASLRESFNCDQWEQLSGAIPRQAPTASASPGASPAAATLEPPAIMWDVAAPSNLDLRAESFLGGLVSRTQPSINMEYVAVRENNLIVRIVYWSPFDIDTDITMSFVELALERIDAAFGSS